MSTDTKNRKEFWNDFYSKQSNLRTLLLPSQFAAFVANEIARETCIIDVGCGNARDSFFFEKFGFLTVGLDASDAAISYAQQRAIETGAQNISFFKTKLQDDVLDHVLASHVGQQKCVYARFFLHAITETEEDNLLGSIASGCQVGDKAAFEYRIEADEAVKKEAEPHFRRFLASADLDIKLEQLGFKKLYGAEGRGYAKYKSEDAIVARGIYEKVTS